MRSNVLPRLAIPTLAVLALGAATDTASATSFVAVADRDLVDQAGLIVVGEVAGVATCRRGDAPCTEVQVRIDRLLKGALDTSPIAVRLPGGVREDGLGLHIFGAPRLEQDDVVLLFLRPDPDRGWRILHLMLGAFHRVQTGTGPAWDRRLGEAAEVVLPPRSGLRRGLREHDAFLAWIADRTAGIHRESDYFLAGSARAEPTTPSSESAGFTLLESGGFNLRWFDFDSGSAVSWRVHEDGQPGLTSQQLLGAVETATAAWSAPFSLIRYQLDSPATTTTSGGLTTFDGVNTFLFENPNNNPDFNSDFSCGSGGILAIGGPWFQNTTIRGFHPIVGGDVITNRGLDCFFIASRDPQNVAEQLFGHELGHTLGIGHSCGDASSPSCSSDPLLSDAIMRASIHNDLRGARLNQDDSAACEALYGLPCIPLLFADGFESGDVTAWSAVVP